jgi:Ca-activated chloride channel homolog
MSGGTRPQRDREPRRAGDPTILPLFRTVRIGLAVLLLSAGRAMSCDLALALAVDVSGSVDAGEYRLQMDGLADALRDGVISEALVRGQAQLMLVQWTGSTRQKITIPWTRIDSFEALDGFAERIASDPRIWRNYSTAIGEALDFVLPAFEQVRDCKRHLIDVSGDGISNEGRPPGDVHAQLKRAGIVVNALAIEASEPDLTAYFFEHVITGEGAFVVNASTFDDYPDRIRRKLLREVTRQTARREENAPTPPVRP